MKIMKKKIHFGFKTSVFAVSMTAVWPHRPAQYDPLTFAALVMLAQLYNAVPGVKRFAVFMWRVAGSAILYQVPK